MTGISDFQILNPHLHEVLESLRGTTVGYWPNIGNAGDSLIAASTYQIFARYEISYEIITDPTKAHDTALVGGGGALVPYYARVRKEYNPFNTINELSKSCKKVIVLPHSVRGNDDFLKELPDNVFFYCREEASYRHVGAFFPPDRIATGHDLALFLNISDILDNEGIRSEAQPLFEAILAGKNIALSDIHNKVVSCLRTDREKLIPPPPDNVDISALFMEWPDGVLPHHAEIRSWMLLEFVRLAGMIITNRLHVAIACALLDKPCIMFDNSYGKLMDVFDFSLRGRYGQLYPATAPMLEREGF